MGTVKSRTAANAFTKLSRVSWVHPRPPVGICRRRPTRPAGRSSTDDEGESVSTFGRPTGRGAGRGRGDGRGDRRGAGGRIVVSPSAVGSPAYRQSPSNRAAIGRR